MSVATRWLRGLVNYAPLGRLHRISRLKTIQWWPCCCPKPFPLVLKLFCSLKFAQLTAIDSVRGLLLTAWAVKYKCWRNQKWRFHGGCTKRLELLNDQQDGGVVDASYLSTTSDLVVTWAFFVHPWQPRSQGSLSCFNHGCSWSQGSQNLGDKTEYGRGTKVNNCRYDKSYSMGARNEFATPFIISSWRGFFKISTMPEKIVVQKCKRQNPGNGFCCSLSISCTGRLIYQSGK